MSTSDTIFLAADWSLERTVDWLAGALNLEQLQDQDLKEGQCFLRGSARTVDGRVLLVLGPNIYGEQDPQPDDVSAIDRYSWVCDVRIAGSKAEAPQAAEARAIFDELAAAQPDTALVLVHAMSWIVAAYLPGAGVHTFPPNTSLDADHGDLWRPWAVS